ncbi:hypothetical protein O0L34_g9327 [Tuta absoluta]|nr:hypothetical protein O0L34_g9327 [Tuta absoluta]
MSFSFGAPSSAPAAGGLNSGFSFGANKPATPGFGLSATSQPSTGLFGSTPTTAAPAFGGGTPGFGATTGFGNTSAFGASAAPSFGATSTAPAFGTAGATPAFGTTSTAPTFGSTTTPAFGATPGFGATSTAPTFGAASTAPAFGSTTTPAFGQTGTTAFGTGGLNFGAGSNTSTAGTGLTLGAPTTSAGLGGLGGFGFGATTAQSTGLGGGLFGATSTASSGLFGAKLGTTTVTGTQPSASAAPSLGLGGVAPAGTTTTTTSGDGKTEPPKQAKLPNEISSTVDSFKEFVKKQKSLSSEIMRVSIKPLHKVAREAEATLRMALTLSAEVCKARAHSRRLRSAAAAALATAESVANSTELEGSAPPLYVKELISELEQQLAAFRRQMDVADKQVQAQPKLLTEQELTLGIRRMHESLVALAGRLQAVHALVNEQKEQYLNLRKYVLNEHTNVFHTEPSSTSLDEILWDADGSRKKQRSTHFTSGNPASAVLADPRAALGNLQQLAGPTPFTYIGNTISPFPNTDTSSVSWQPQPQTSLSASLNASTEPATFHLQKPPGKRGKQ